MAHHRHSLGLKLGIYTAVSSPPGCVRASRKSRPAATAEVAGKTAILIARASPRPRSAPATGASTPPLLWTAGAACTARVTMAVEALSASRHASLRRSSLGAWCCCVVVSWCRADGQVRGRLWAGVRAGEPHDHAALRVCQGDARQVGEYAWPIASPRRPIPHVHFTLSVCLFRVACRCLLSSPFRSSLATFYSSEHLSTALSLSWHPVRLAGEVGDRLDQGGRVLAVRQADPARAQAHRRSPPQRLVRPPTRARMLCAAQLETDVRRSQWVPAT